MRLAEIAQRLGGRPVEGDASVALEGVASLAEGGAGDLGFVRSDAFRGELERSRIGALIAPPGLDVGGRPVLRSAAPSLDFARAARLLRPERRPPPGVHPAAAVDPAAHVDASAHVGPFACVGPGARVGAGCVLHAHAVVGADATLGADCVVHPGACVGPGCVLGARVVLHPGAVIGADGFGYEFNERGEHEKVPQLGIVVLGDDVEVGANATVDRARLGATRVGRGTKIDNLVMVGHNCEIGEHVLVVAQSGLAGGSVLGDRVVVMAQVGVANRAVVGEGAFLAARAGVFDDVPPRARIWGFPGRPERAWHRSMAWLARLPELARRLRRVERALGLRNPPGEEP